MFKEAWPLIAKAHLKPYLSIRGSSKQAESPAQPTLIQAIFHLISYYENVDLAQKAITLFGGSNPEIFSSWNEVRMATAREIHDELKILGAVSPELFSVASQIKEMLQICFEMFEEVPEGLNEISGLDQINQFIEKIGWEAEWFPDYLRGFWDKVTVVDQLTTLVLTRLGVVEAQDSSSTIKKQLKTVTGMSGHNAHLLMVATAKNYCKSDQPLCQICPCQKECKFAITSQKSQIAV